MVYSILRRNDGGLICKLDIEKAYDHLSWEFVIEVMRIMGFGHKWLAWVGWCMSIASSLILINGTPICFFWSSRGLRQGDPLSMYLVVIGMDVLSCLINKVVEGNFLTGCKVGDRDEGEEELILSHLLYTDDTLLFCKASLDQLTHLGWILIWFVALSGLKINLGKSEILPTEGVGRMEDPTAKLGFKIGSLPSTYLGLPLGAPHKSVGASDPIEERFRMRFAAWKCQYISNGGRVTLIRSTLSSLPIYFMSLFRIPSRVCKRLLKIQRYFLWGNRNLDHKPHLVNWATVCLYKKNGGLGVRGLFKLNKSLLGKWNWCFTIERNSLWRNTINSKFGEMQGGEC